MRNQFITNSGNLCSWAEFFRGNDIVVSANWKYEPNPEDTREFDGHLKRRLGDDSEYVQLEISVNL